MTKLELLRAGLKALGPNGENWGKGMEIYICGNECAITALWAGLEISPSDRRSPTQENEFLVKQATKVLQENLPINTGGLVSQFNDNPITTFEDVKSLYERSIKSLEAK